MKKWETELASHLALIRARGDDATIKALDRFLPKVKFGNGCWEWTRGRTKLGYGKFTVGGKTVTAHRWLRLAAYGPSRLHCDHLCRNPPCVRPSHIEMVTIRENNRRKAAIITHCPHGHEYTALNTVWTARAHGLARYCRQCNRDSSRMRARESYARDPEKYRQIQRDRRRARRERRGE